MNRHYFYGLQNTELPNLYGFDSQSTHHILPSSGQTCNVVVSPVRAYSYRSKKNFQTVTILKVREDGNSQDTRGHYCTLCAPNPVTSLGESGNYSKGLRSRGFTQVYDC